MTPTPARAPLGRPPRLGFVLTVAAGNRTRFDILKKYAERTPGYECVWAPIQHFLDPDPLAFLPESLRVRAEVLWEARPVLERGAELDAVLFHAFEPFVLAVLGSRIARGPAIVWSQDNPPSVDASVQYSGRIQRSPLRRRLRFGFDAWCARRVDLFLPFSAWAGDVLVRDCGVARERVRPLHVGVDLEFWPAAPPPRNERPRLLFVGGNFARKGGELLLRVHQRALAARADLDLVTREPPAALPPGVRVHTDLEPNDPRLRALFAAADVLVLPTLADLSPFVLLEAMATGRAVVSTRVGGIADLVRDGETGLLVPPGDEGALERALRQLLEAPDLRVRFGSAAREVVERDYCAARNVPQLLEAMATLGGLPRLTWPARR